jgi:adenosylmethionine-8-amino-7-oxononanoate aminotransferase
VINSVESSKRYMHAFTYSGHPTTCAVALANLDYFEKHDVIARAAETGAYLQKRLKTLERHAQVGETRGLGMMAAVELLEDRASRKRFDPAKGYGEKLRLECVKRGLWSRAMKDSYYLSPPLTTSREEVDRIVDILDESLRALFK